MRYLLGFAPSSDEEIDFHRHAYDTPEALRDAFLRTPQAHALFQQANEEYHIGLSARSAYMIRPFLLDKPAFDEVPWAFKEPSLDNPVWQLCTSEQMQTATYRSLCDRLGLEWTAPHRKVWEFAFILAALEHKRMLLPGYKGLGFGTGTEHLPSVFARSGLKIVATDAPSELGTGETWGKGGQWSQSLEDLWHPNLVDRETFFGNVEFRPVDMNAIPADLSGFDFCWSACAFEHLGSIKQGLDFLHNSLLPLRAGGVSVHTTEFNLQSNTETLDRPGLGIFRKIDFETVARDLIDAGHSVEPINLWPGIAPVDQHIDLPPYGFTHLKLEMEGWQTTSIGVIITKSHS